MSEEILNFYVESYAADGKPCGIFELKKIGGDVSKNDDDDEPPNRIIDRRRLRDEIIVDKSINKLEHQLLNTEKKALTQNDKGKPPLTTNANLVYLSSDEEDEESAMAVTSNTVVTTGEHDESVNSAKLSGGSSSEAGDDDDDEGKKMAKDDNDECNAVNVWQVHNASTITTIHNDWSLNLSQDDEDNASDNITVYFR